MEVGGDVLEIGTHDETTDDVLLLLYLLHGWRSTIQTETGHTYEPLIQGLTINIKKNVTVLV